MSSALDVVLFQIEEERTEMRRRLYEALVPALRAVADGDAGVAVMAYHSAKTAERHWFEAEATRFKESREAGKRTEDD